MTLGLIPRVRVNYGYCDLIKALFTSEHSHDARQECEQILSSFFDSEHVLLVPSARDAIYELLIRLPQKKVLLPAYTCIAVVEAVKLAGKEIVFCETDNKNYNSSYIDAITPDCIVLATHQYGLPCNIEEIADRSNAVGAVLIEDCATSMGTTVNGKKTGTFGEYAMVSFNASKLLNVPPFGGLLISKNHPMIEDIKTHAEWKNPSAGFKIKGLIRGLAFVLTKNAYFYRLFHYLTIASKGKLQKTEHEKAAEEKTPLYSYFFSEWQAVILLKQLKRLEEVFAKRKELYSYYDKNITNPIIQKPPLYENAVCCRYAIQVEDRNAFYKECLRQGVDMDFSHCSLGCPDSFEVEHKMANKIFNLPFFYDLSEREKKKIIEVINNISLE